MDTLRTVADYVDKVQEKYPEINKKDIERIITYGFRQFYLMSQAGSDFILSTGCKSEGFKISAYVGYILRDKGMMNRYICLKRAIKYRLLWLRKRVQYDGYYYFALSKEDYARYKEEAKENKGKVTFERLKVYKVPEEILSTNDQGHPYLFKIPFDEEGKFVKVLENFTTKKCEYIGMRKKDGNISFVNDNEKKRSKLPNRRHDNRLYAAKHAKNGFNRLP